MCEKYHKKEDFFLSEIWCKQRRQNKKTRENAISIIQQSINFQAKKKKGGNELILNRTGI